LAYKKKIKEGIEEGKEDKEHERNGKYSLVF
jgi:hypothetical protein